MISRLIADYMATNRRLVVPEFGAFIKKDEEAMVAFVPFLKRDDGVLSALVAEAVGVSVDDAVAMIDEYVFSIRESVMNSGSFTIDGLGVLLRDANGVFTMRYDNSVSTNKIQPVVESKIEELVQPMVPDIKEPKSNPPQQDISEDHIDRLYGGGTEVKSVRRLAEPKSAPRKVSHSAASKKSTGSGFIMLLAILAILAAVAVMLYGMGIIGGGGVTPAELKLN